MNRIYYETLRAYANLILAVRLMLYRAEYFSWVLFNNSKNTEFPKNVKTVLVYNQCPLGDFFSSIRVLISVLKKNPGKDFYFCIASEIKPQIENIFKIKNLHLIDKHQLKERHYDLSILLTPDELTDKSISFLGFIIGNEYHSIRGSLRQIRFGRRLNRKIPPKWRHKIKQEIEIFKFAKLFSDDKLESFRPKENAGVLAFLKSKKITKFIVIHPSGRNFAQLLRAGKVPSLAWSLERFAEICDYITKDLNLVVILTGSKDEKFIGEKIISLAKNKHNLHNASGRFDIAELTSLASESELIISIDTSMVHIGEFVGAKIISLFGPTYLEEVGAYGDEKIQINLGHPEKCIRDRKKGSSHDEENRGMNSISVEEVKRAIKKLIHL